MEAVLVSSKVSLQKLTAIPPVTTLLQPPRRRKRVFTLYTECPFTRKFERVHSLQTRYNPLYM